MPPLVVLLLGIDATTALVVSQAVLALALPVTLVPLLLLTMSPAVMGSLRPGPIVRVAAVVVTALITIMDVALLSLLFTGRLG